MSVFDNIRILVDLPEAVFAEFCSIVSKYINGETIDKKIFTRAASKSREEMHVLSPIFFIVGFFAMQVSIILSSPTLLLFFFAFLW